MAVKGLASLKRVLEEKAEAAKQFDRPKPNWFKLPKDNTAKIQFLQEIDEESDLYKEAAGLGVFSHEFEFRKGKDSRTLAYDPEDDWRDSYAGRAEQLIRKRGVEDEDFKKTFTAKRLTYLYIMVLADLGEGWKPYLLKRNATAGTFVKTLIADSEDYGNITGAVYRIMKGDEQVSPWTLQRLDKAPLQDTSNVEVPDVESFIINVDESGQERYLAAVLPEIDTPAPAKVAPAAVPDASDDW